MGPAPAGLRFSQAKPASLEGVKPYVLAEVAGLPDNTAVPLALVAVVVLALITALVALYRELRQSRAEHTAYVEAQVQISQLRDQAQDEKALKQSETIAKLTGVAELLTQAAQGPRDPRDPRNRGSGGNIR